MVLMLLEIQQLPSERDLQSEVLLLFLFLSTEVSYTMQA